jgi:hypothetical protein
MTTLSSYPLSELKLVYRILHGSLLTHIDLMDAELLSDLQAVLREAATSDGIDTADHGAWDAWLGSDAVTPPPSPKKRQRFTLVDGGKA